MASHPDVQIVGVPSDLGAGRRGVDMGPSAIRYAHLAEAIEELGIQCRDQGNVDVPLPERSPSRQPKLRQLESVIKVTGRVREEVAEVLTTGQMPLVLGGDHSLSIGTLAGVCAAWENPGVLWVDAHGDFNTPTTTPSGNIHGMSLALGCGRGAPELLELFRDERYLDPSRVALIGARSLDPQERELLKSSGVAVFTMSDIDRRGVRQVLDDALRQVTSGTDGVHVSFDMDVVDPNVAPGVGTPVGGGLSYREAHLLMETVAEFAAMGSLEMVEVNPILDNRNQTASRSRSTASSAASTRAPRQPGAVSYRRRGNRISSSAAIRCTVSRGGLDWLSMNWRRRIVSTKSTILRWGRRSLCCRAATSRRAQPASLPRRWGRTRVSTATTPTRRSPIRDRERCCAVR